MTSNDIICNGGPNPLVTPFSKTVINVPAGATVGAQWDHALQPNGWTASDPADPYVLSPLLRLSSQPSSNLTWLSSIDPGHLGPVMAYMAK